MEKNRHTIRKGIAMAGGILLTCTLVCGCGNASAVQQEPAVQTEATQAAQHLPPEQKLRLGVVKAPEETGLGFKQALLEENTEDSFTKVAIYQGIAQATWEADGGAIPLEDALAQGIITQEEIACYAQLDARNGYCVETQQTKHGLTHFTYTYPDFNLRVINDVYVTPDGGEDRIRHTVIYPNRPDQILGPYVDFLDPVTGQRTDWENWGLAFQVEEVSPTEVKIRCTQSSGQQIGVLTVEGYSLAGENLPPKKQGTPEEAQECAIALKQNSETAFTINWEQLYGALPAGSYRLSLSVRDYFAEEAVPPLTQDYHDWQVYDLEFTVK